MTDTVVIDDDKQAQIDFDAGAAEIIPPAKPAVEVKVEPKVEAKVEAKPKVEAKVPAKVETVPPVQPAPKHVQITEEQYRRFEEAAVATATMKTQLAKVFGTIGDVQQVVKKLQAATPAGVSVDIPKDAFAEMAKDFPELATHFQSGLEKALKGVRGTGTAVTSTAPDAEEVQKLVMATYIKGETESLEDAYANWREIVGTVDAQGRHDPNNEFRKWLATQDIGYQHKINSTNSSRTIATAIGKFLALKAAQAKTPVPTPKLPAPKIVARQNRIAAAVTPRGDGGQPAPSKSADDDFNAGFATG